MNSCTDRINTEGPPNDRLGRAAKSRMRPQKEKEAPQQTQGIFFFSEHHSKGETAKEKRAEIIAALKTVIGVTHSDTNITLSE